MRYIEIYDPTGGWVVTQGGVYYVPFPTTRATNDVSLYTVSSVFNTVAPDGNGISVSESGNYLIIYTITATVSSGLSAICQLFNRTTSTVVPGTTTVISPNGPEIVSVTGKAVLNISNNDVYCVRITTASGKAGDQIEGYLSASSLTFIKLEALGEGETFRKNQQSGTSYTLALADINSLVEMTSSSANTVEIPLDSTVNFPAGSKIQVVQSGTGQTEIVPESGVTILSASGYTKIATRYSFVNLIKDDVADQWYLHGSLTA